MRLVERVASARDNDMIKRIAVALACSGLLSITIARPAQAAPDSFPIVVKSLREHANTLAQKCKNSVDPVCVSYCPKGTERLCALDDELVAPAAAATDAGAIEDLFANDPIKTLLSPPDKDAARALAKAPADARSLVPGVASVSSDLVTVALQGLAKFVADRAKQEAVGWFLDEVGDSLCREGESEIRDYWLPHTCTLAVEQRLSYYGAGAELLDGLHQALVVDARGWPGAGAGAALGGGFYADAPASGYGCDQK